MFVKHKFCPLFNFRGRTIKNTELMQTQINELKFSGHNIYVGIDAHLKSWRVTVMLNGVMEKTFSQDPIAEKLQEYLHKRYPGGNYYSAYEAGFCGFSVHRSLERAGIKNIVVNPADIPVTDKEKRQKEDKRDSRKIARTLHNGELKGIHVPRRETEELRTFLRYRKTLVKEISRHKNRVKSLLHYYGISIPEIHQSASRHWSKRFTNWLREVKFETSPGRATLDRTIATVEFLRKQLLETTRDIKKLSEGSLSRHVALLRTVPGIGLIMAMTLLSELEEVMRFRNLDSLCSYVGLIPTTHSSGDSDKTGNITPRSNKWLRNMIVESSWIAIRHDPTLMLCYQEKCKSMKGTDAIIRVAKKLLNRIRHVLKNNEAYQIAVVK